MLHGLSHVKVTCLTRQAEVIIASLLDVSTKLFRITMGTMNAIDACMYVYLAKLYRSTVEKRQLLHFYFIFNIYLDNALSKQSDIHYD